MKLKRDEFISTFSRVSAESSAKFSEVGVEKNMAEAGNHGAMLSVLSGLIVCHSLEKELFGDGDDDEIDIDRETFDKAYERVINGPDFDEITSGGMIGLVAGIIATLTVSKVRDTLFGEEEKNASEESDH